MGRDGLMVDELRGVGIEMGEEYCTRTVDMKTKVTLQATEIEWDDWMRRMHREEEECRNDSLSSITIDKKERKHRRECR